MDATLRRLITVQAPQARGTRESARGVGYVGGADTGIVHVGTVEQVSIGGEDLTPQGTRRGAMFRVLNAAVHAMRFE